MAQATATLGVWAKAGRCGGKPVHQHANGVKVAYNCNRWLWEIIGGASDGLAYKALWLAQYEVERVA